MSLFANVEFSSVQWGRTSALNTLRSFAAGLAWAVVVLISSGGSAASGWWFIPVVLPAGYVMFLPIYFLTCKIMTAFSGDIGQLGVNLMTFLLALAVAVGDPLVYFLHRAKPYLVPTHTRKPINVTTVLYVTDPERAGSSG